MKYLILNDVESCIVLGEEEDVSSLLFLPDGFGDESFRRYKMIQRNVGVD